MSKFTEAELEYLKVQNTGRLATVNKRGEPQNTPVLFRYNAELDTIDIGGPEMASLRNFGILSAMVSPRLSSTTTPLRVGVASRFAQKQKSILKVDKLFIQLLAQRSFA